MSTLDDLCAEDNGQNFTALRRKRLLHEILDNTKTEVQPRRRLKDVVRAKTAKQPEKTVVTPAVYEIAKTIFLPHLLLKLHDVNNSALPPPLLCGEQSNMTPQGVGRVRAE